MSDFGNAAMTVFLALLTRVIITYDLDLTIPISQVNENMNTAHRRDAVRKEKFYFRCGTEVSQMNINEIINGTNNFLGLVPYVRRYIGEQEDINADTRHTIEQYLLLVSRRAAGKLVFCIYHVKLKFFFYRNFINKCCMDTTICTFTSII